jgi:diguanylate cyclase (GGDEF)-like protein/PAS domain S-box-containing protein
MEKETDSTLPNQQAFQKNVEQLQLALGATHQGWFEINLVTGKAIVNEQYAIMLGYNPEGFEETLELWCQRVHPDDLLTVRAAYRDYVAGRRPDYHVEFRERTCSNEWIWILSVGAIVAYDEQGKPLKLGGTRIDISARKQAERLQSEADQRLAFTLEAAKLGDFTLDLRSGITLHSMQHDRCFGYNKPIVDWDYEIFLAHIVEKDRDRINAVFQTAMAGGNDYEIEFQARWPDGTVRWLWSKGRFYLDEDGKPERAVGIVGDITERKHAETEINRLAYFDQLTGLPNRRWLIDHLDEACHQARADNRVDALLFMDLDHFKRVNDVRGHAVGDALLKCMADRIRERLGDRGTAGRLGGDEFVIHIANAAKQFGPGSAAALKIAHEILLAIQPAVEIDGQVYSETVSIGVTLFPKAAETANDLLREADTAMYRAKEGGRNRVVMFEAAMHAELEFQLGLERDLALALHSDELQLHCQPQVNYAGDLVGAELLLRWTQAERGAIPPAVFIPLAEESDLIICIGGWVIDAACSIEVKTRQHGLTIPLSINISPKQFKHPAFLSQVSDAISATKACASRLIFEVTEGLLIEDMEQIVERMKILGALGIRFSIDDFGTGYSSLSYLKRLPLYELKIDKSFVEGLPADADDVAIVQSMLSIAKHLQLRVVAEGVETREQADFLINSGCDCLQGYLFGRPVAIGQFLASYP